MTSMRIPPRPFLAAILPFLLLGGASGGGGDDELRWGRRETDRLVELAGEYQEQTGATARDEVLARVRDLGPVPERRLREVVKALFKVARSGPRCDGRGTCVAKYEPFPGTYYLSGAGGGRKGVFIGLHGGAPGVGDGRSAQSLWGGAGGKGLIGVFPTANLEGRRTTWQSPEVEGFVLAILKELKRTYRIDTNRVYVAGHSLGGSGAWHLGPRHADLLAGMSANAGGLRGHQVAEGVRETPGGFVANLHNTPCFFTHYDQDPRVAVGDARAIAKELGELRAEHPGGYEHRYIEGEGPSHGFPPKAGPSAIIQWLTSRKRDPYPPKLVWEPSGGKRLFAWLRLANPPLHGSRNFRIVAEIEGNEVRIAAPRTKGLSILLSEEMFEPEDPVTVLVNGEERFRETIRPDPAALVESILESIDPERFFAYRIDL
jgi:dienelactone hydrolase